jgi:hypothetical protein
MPDIGHYTEAATLVLVEAIKYFAVLLLVVLAVRLWRRSFKIPSARRAGSVGVACLVSLAAVALGYVFTNQSLGKLYSYYGMRAFHAGRLPQAHSLFQSAAGFWNNADAEGQQGVCLLLTGNAEQGLQLINGAKARRHGVATPFEGFYEGLYYFLQGDTAKSIPALQVAGTDTAYRWSVIKLFAVMELEAGRHADAAVLMKPFMEVEVTECDQAYVMAALKLDEGKNDEALVLLDKFDNASLSPAWKTRFDKLRAKARG